MSDVPQKNKITEVNKIGKMGLSVVGNHDQRKTLVNSGPSFLKNEFSDVVMFYDNHKPQTNVLYKISSD